MNGTEREAWLKLRREGIGGSDIAAVMNRSPFAGPRAIWESKVNGVESDIDPELAYWGNAHEPSILRRYAEDNPHLEVMPNQTNTVEQFREWPVAMATLDGEEWDEAAQGRAVLEAKTAGAFARGWEPDGVVDGIPEHLRLQIMWYMGITGIHVGRCLSLHGGNDYRVHQIMWDAELFDLMLDEAKLFWDAHVLTEIPPSPDSPVQARMLFPKHRGETLIADRELGLFIGDRVQLSADLAEVKGRLERIDAEIMGRMEWHEHLDLPIGARVASWRAPKKGTVAHKAVAADLRGRLRMGQKKWDALQDEYRSAPSRRFTFTLKSED